MINYECISIRLLKVTIELRSDRIAYFDVYVQYSSYEDTYVKNVVGTLQDEINILPLRYNIVLLGDFNASVGIHMQIIWPEVDGGYGAGEHNEIGIKLLQCCAINNLFIENIYSSTKKGEDIHVHHQNVQICKLILL